MITRLGSRSLPRQAALSAGARSVIFRRTYAEGPAANDPPPPPPRKHTIQPTPHKPTEHPTRHEVHEGSSAINVPFNPPGGGGGSGIGGTSMFEFTKNPFLDAALTTIIGLGMGTWPILPVSFAINAP